MTSTATMNYQVLARKWRPHHFNELIGQEPILRMLSNALDQQRLHHAYLFTGTRGVGKTTIARILAKCLNCAVGISANPCNTCDACQAIDQGRFLDLLEIDAASRTKVEDTRELLDNVQYAPTQGRFKIYLIDEVHMLSGHSFNALLKTLEEPPAHVKFILATTDPKRLPITVLSRCLQFNLKRVSTDQITQQLQHICTNENMPAETPALALLAQAADGSLRDALSLLDQAIAYGGHHIILTDIQQMLGTLPEDYFYQLLTALADHDGEKLFQDMNRLAEWAPNYDHVLAGCLTALHQIAVAQVIASPYPEPIQQLAKRISPEDIQLYYQIALIGRRDLSLAPDPAYGFEMVMLRMLAFKPTTLGSSVSIEKISAHPATVQAASTPPMTKNATSWNEILPKLALSGLTHALAANCVLEKSTDETIELTLSTTHESMLTTKLTARIEEALRRYFNRPITLKISLTTSALNTPIKQQQKIQEARQASATQSITSDSNVQKIVDLFNATLDVNSVQATD